MGLAPAAYRRDVLPGHGLPGHQAPVHRAIPLTISLLRYGLATLALLPWFPRVKAGDAAALALLGLLGVALFSFCLTAGVAMSSASSASLLTNSQPIFTTLLAPLIIDEKLTPRRLAGALLGLGGVALIVTEAG